MLQPDNATTKRRRAHLAAWMLAASLSATTTSAQSPDTTDAVQPVALELILAVDGSTSVDTWEFALQITGLAKAFRTPEVIAAVRQAGAGGIAVALVEWAGSGNQALAVDWTLVRDAETGAALAEAIEATPRHFIGRGTAIAEALEFMIPLFEQNAYRGTRKVIDLSGDGRDNRGADPRTLRDRAVASGITINGLAILEGAPDLGRYYTERVAGGTGAFVMTVDRYEDFAAAIVKKLVREIAGSPLAAAPPERARGWHHVSGPRTCFGGTASCKGGARLDHPVPQ